MKMPSITLVPLAPILALVIGISTLLYVTGFVGPTPKIGDVYVTRGGGNPWSEKAKYVVLEVKDGWVLWKHQYGQPIPCKFTVVRSMYKKIGTTPVTQLER